MEEKNELIKELFKLWENLYEVGEIYAGYGFSDNYKRLEAKVKNLTIPDVVVPKGTYCEFYKKECMKEFCSVTHNWQKCKHLK